MDHNTETQLRLIQEIADALSHASIRWWLYGGWGMDFHVGRITRDHSDIELFIWRDDLDTVREVLVSHGFVAPAWGLYPDEVQPFLKEGQEIGAWFLERDEQGRIVTPGRWADWPWLRGAFDGPPGRIGEVEAPVMDVAGLLDMKEDFPKHRHGGPLRPKDEADIVVLRGLLRDSQG